MSNVQQPEMRRGGHNPIVASSRQEKAQGSLPRGSGRASGSRASSGKDTRPAGQKSRYGPENTEQERAGGQNSQPRERSRR